MGASPWHGRLSAARQVPPWHGRPAHAVIPWPGRLWHGRLSAARQVPPRGFAAAWKAALRVAHRCARKDGAPRPGGRVSARFPIPPGARELADPTTNKATRLRAQGAGRGESVGEVRASAEGCLSRWLTSEHRQGSQPGDYGSSPSLWAGSASERDAGGSTGETCLEADRRAHHKKRHSASERTGADISSPFPAVVRPAPCSLADFVHHKSARGNPTARERNDERMRSRFPNLRDRMQPQRRKALQRTGRYRFTASRA